MSTASLTFPLTHIQRLTDAVGMLEHCIFSTPDRIEGYAVDDNARALQVMLRSGAGEGEVTTYLQFLLSARAPEGFHQDLNADMTWKNDAGVEEGYGRVMAALGEAAMTAPTDHQKLTAAFVFDQLAPLMSKIHGSDQLRAAAQVITAITHRLQFETAFPELVPHLIARKKLKGDMATELAFSLKDELTRLADGLALAYSQHVADGWKWYEDILSYDNARLPLGMFYATQVTGNQKYQEIAVESLDFLLSQIYDTTKDCFSFPGYRGWFPKDGQKAEFGQQPIEAGSTVEVCAAAYQLTHDQKYLDMAHKALAWYTGKNISGLELLDTTTGGVKDGLEPWGLNPNQGAESILSYALACLAINQVTQ